MKIFILVFFLGLFSMLTVYATTSASIHLDRISEFAIENNVVTFSGQMTTSNGNPISNHTIFIKDNTPYGEPNIIFGIGKTDDNGRFSISWKAVPKNNDDYYFYAVYLGGKTYGFTESESYQIHIIPLDTPRQNQPLSKLPDWFKNSSKMWYDGQIKDSRFAYGIENLMDQNIIQRQPSDNRIYIPYWVKNTANWYVEGQISDDDFLNLIQYLINNKIINV